MIDSRDVQTTLRMVQEENLDVRTITLGINLGECADRDPGRMTEEVRRLILDKAGRLVAACDEVSARYGVPVVNKRLAVSAASGLLEGHGPAAARRLAETLDLAARDVGVDLIGGFSAWVHGGMTPGERLVIESLPDVLTRTGRVCASVNVASTRSGINVDAVLLVAGNLLRAALADAGRGGFAAAKLVVFANMPENNPFMAGAVLGTGEGAGVINVGVSGPGVIKRAIDRLVKVHPAATLDAIAEEIKHTAFRVTRTGELLGREVARRLRIPFGVVDLSLAPTPHVGDSVGEIYQSMGLGAIGAPGTTAAVALVNDAVKKGGAFASSSVGGLSGAFIPVMEDHVLSAAVARGDLTLEKLEAMTAVCSVGLDMILLPGDIAVETLAGIILDEVAIGVTNRKTTGVRVIPSPGKKVGDRVDFGGLFGAGTVTAPACANGSAPFVRRGGHIPAPIHSMNN